MSSSIVNVLDFNYDTHDINNIYVVNSSFLPSIGAINLTLTMVANAVLCNQTSQTNINY
ncbi:MAG: GMC oxidoreductase [Cyanobacteria bacterium J06649_11]